RQIHRVTLGHVERVVPRIHVPDHPVGAEGRGRMRIRCDLADERFLPRLALPDLSKGQEEALITGEAVDDGGRLTVERDLIRAIGHLETAEVADVLAEREPAVD